MGTGVSDAEAAPLQEPEQAVGRPSSFFSSSQAIAASNCSGVGGIGPGVALMKYFMGPPLVGASLVRSIPPFLRSAQGSTQAPGPGDNIEVQVRFESEPASYRVRFRYQS